MAYGETIIIQSWIKDSIINRLRDCGCDDEQIEDCWNSFIESVAEMHSKLKQARKTDNFTGFGEMAMPFLDLVQNLHAVDLMIYTKNLNQAIQTGDWNGLDRAANDLMKICEKYLTGAAKKDEP